MEEYGNEGTEESRDLEETAEDLQTDSDGDDSVDSSDADPIEDGPDPSQAAEPVDNVGEVEGRRNEDLPTEVPEEAEFDPS